MQRLLVPQRVDFPEAAQLAAGTFDAWEFSAGAMFRVVAIHCQARRTSGNFGVLPVVRNIGNDKIYWQASGLVHNAGLTEVQWVDQQPDQAGDILSGTFFVFRALRGVWIQATEAVKLGMLWFPGTAAAGNNFRNCFYTVEVLDLQERARGDLTGVIVE